MHNIMAVKVNLTYIRSVVEGDGDIEPQNGAQNQRDLYDDERNVHQTTPLAEIRRGGFTNGRAANIDVHRKEQQQ
jgi:hypothetical protein